MSILAHIARNVARDEVVVFASTGGISPSSAPPDYSFVEFLEADLDAPGLFREKDRPRFFPQRLKQGHRCFGWRGAAGEVAGYLWLATSVAPPAPWLLDLKLRLGPAHAYIWDCRTAPGHEGKGLYGIGMLKLAAVATQMKAETVLIDSSPANGRSLAAIERAGFQRQGVVSVRRLGAVYLVRWRDARHVVWKIFNSATLIAAPATGNLSA